MSGPDPPDGPTRQRRLWSTAPTSGDTVIVDRDPGDEDDARNPIDVLLELLRRSLGEIGLEIDECGHALRDLVWRRDINP
jgi:hypothetical protein